MRVPARQSTVTGPAARRLPVARNAPVAARVRRGAGGSVAGRGGPLFCSRTHVRRSRRRRAGDCPSGLRPRHRADQRADGPRPDCRIVAGFPRLHTRRQTPSDGAARVRPPSSGHRGAAPCRAGPLLAAVRRFLWASYLDEVDKPQAEREFAALRRQARELPEPSATLLGYVNDRDVAHLGPRLLPYIGSYVSAPALSPSRSPAPSAPVFLLHGRDDNVIPAYESQRLADRLRGRVPVRLLLSALISHAAADQPVRMKDVGELARFWGDILEPDAPLR